MGDENKDRKFLRYMTVSSKGLPDGVTEGISRAHFPLANPPLSKDVHVCVTEGPLKADAASELLGPDAKVFFIALHGTMNTKELPDFFKLCKKKGSSALKMRSTWIRPQIAMLQRLGKVSGKGKSRWTLRRGALLG